MFNHLILQKHSHHFLLIEYPDRYHIITVNKRLDPETEEWILASICTDAFFDDAGLTRDTLLKSEVRGVAVGGYTAGSVIVLYQKKNKHQYVLSDDYEEAYIDEMFAGFERFLAPESIGSEKHSSDWRKELQNPTQKKSTGIIGSVLNVIGVVYSLLYLLLGDGNPFWFLSGVLIGIVSLVIYLLCPQYYSIMTEKMYKKYDYKAGVTHVYFAVLFPLASVGIRSMTLFTIRNWGTMFIWAVVFSALLTVFLYFLSREMRGCVELVVVVAFAFLVSGIGISMHTNHLLNVNAALPEAYVVTDKEHRNVRKGPNRYECVIVLEDGSELDLNVPSNIYHQVDVGDEIMVYVGKGALGIEYAYYVDICE